MFKKLMSSQKSHMEKNKLKNDEKRSGNRIENNNKTLYEFRSNGKYDVELSNNLITITNKGTQNFMTKGVIGSKTIKIENISAVQLKEWSKLTGYIQFIVIGSQENKGGVLGAVQDENTVTFSTKLEESWAKEIKGYIDNYSTAPLQVASSSIADELLKFKNLLDLGIINKNEFEAKKKELLNT